MSGILKRKFEEVEASSPCSSPRESDDDASSSESGDSGDSVNPSASSHFTPASILKREKRMRTRSVHFEKVTVYYFTRRQGFTSVPSQGGSSLGMSSRHCGIRQYTLGEFALEQERIHRDMLHDHLKEEKLNAIKLKLTKNGTVESDEASVLTVDDISDDDIDLDNTEVDEYFFLQPLTTKKRRALLRASGVKKIDVEEKHELRAIRVSREDCGCDCRIFCDPETCACSMAGIKCQVDRMSFPCGCTKEGCSNTAGRIEFNPIRVRTHFLHTIMKLELEKSREQQQASTANGGYHGEANMHSSALLPAQHGLEYSLVDAVPQTAIMHLQAAEEMDEPIEDEEEEEEEDDDDEEEDEDEEDDASSLCSGLTDSSTQSLAASDSEEEDDEEDKSDSFEDTSITSPGSHSEAVPLSSVLCYSEGAVVQDNHTNGNCYFSSTPPEYYQLETASTASINATANPTSESYGEVSPFQDGVPNGNGNFNAASEQYPDYNGQPEEPYVNHFGLANGTSTVIVRSPDHEDNVRPGGVYREQPGGLAQVEFQNYLNNNSQERYVSNGNCFVAEKVKEVTSGMNEVPPLPDSRQNPAILESFPQVAPV
ncbi:cysteine/serine-rich nuclear protein 3 [Paramormyrops kingsleyae]|uniref:Cysteine and serine rich nuclear protein 3 n=1 Tax=Paramormyrops kingsleyae TaxID=1676925 RepID=A0A3B3R3S6_9TELE|nr:cysteine/serine-rich nuclear protein 3 [Paramormyrops kingsleyae]XP_023657442.1 cysteine/serine-rich nuclear protein 3 [Paramormyrops kingsleyae]XP_023658245.1 cysteine/serine-rich nuclear protein 3 [Paramormyrops kingsleyae]XP_023659058.1 cysteine/serine-rich nuclear protein 3 [Paramormyrops kingsleyae]XP_023659855.1 cysteine/serine-rich nuclear protein 3 [Paramormyrops kingsleyae]